MGLSANRRTAPTTAAIPPSPKRIKPDVLSAFTSTPVWVNTALGCMLSSYAGYPHVACPRALRVYMRAAPLRSCSRTCVVLRLWRTIWPGQPMATTSGF